MNQLRSFMIVGWGIGLFCALGNPTTAAADWLHWRGPHANGSSDTAKPPLEWSEDKNVRWKVPLEGLGNSTPIILKNRVYVTTAVPTDRIDETLPKPEDQPRRLFGIVYPNNFFRFEVIALDRATGKQVWKTTCAEQVPHKGHHSDNSFATPSVVTDGKRIYAWFGSAGLHCLDMNGKPIWKKDFGKVDTRLSFGEGASPVLADGTLLIIRDNEDQSYLVALDPESGNEKWRQNRDEPSAWATPLVVKHGGKTQVITNASNRVRSYDLKDGSLIWECGGQVSNVTPSPVVIDDVVICMSGYRGSSAMAIPLSSLGDITDDEKVAWSLKQGTPYVPSPVLYKGIVYFNSSNRAMISAVDAKTGKVHYSRERLPRVGSIYSSPVAANDRIYWTYRDGRTVVIEHGTESKVLATNQLDDGIDASIALAGKEIFIRGKKNIYCIAEDKTE